VYSFKTVLTRGRGKVGGGAFPRGLVLDCDGGRYMGGKVWLCGRESERRIPEDGWGVPVERGLG